MPSNENMFKDITINLKYPICDCEKENLNWNIPDNGEGLAIYCGTCNTMLYVSDMKFVAHFKLEIDYPIPDEDEKDKLQFWEEKEDL